MKRFGILIAILTLLGCGSTTKTHTITEQDTKILDNMVTERFFEIEAEWAQPQLTRSMAQLSNSGLFPLGSNSGNISLIGNGNYIRMKGEKVHALMPYFGERQMGGAYNNNANGIEFEGIPLDLEVNKGKEENSYEIIFNINDKNNPTESHRVVISLFPNLKSSVNINSNQRFPIRYRGRVKNLEKENES